MSTTWNSELIIGRGFDGKWTVPKVPVSLEAELIVAIGFKWVHNYSQSVTKTYNKIFKNIAGNYDGSKGYLLIEKPSFTNHNYHRMTADGTKKLNEINLSFIKDWVFDIEPYDLESPPAGMTKRDKTSEYAKCFGRAKYSTDNIFYGEANSLTANLDGHSSDMSISTSNEYSHQWSPSLKVTGKLAALFKSTTEYNLSCDIKHTYAISKNVRAALELLEPPEDPDKAVLERINVQPYWLQPKKKGEVFWIPTEYKTSEPWCLTWNVVKYKERGEYYVRSVANDFDGDGVSDVVLIQPLTEEMDGGTIIEQAKIVLSPNGQEQLENNLWPPGWFQRLMATAHFSGDWKTDILWMDTRFGTLTVYLMDGLQADQSVEVAGLTLDDSLVFIGTADLVGRDGCAEILVGDMTSGSLIACVLNQATFAVDQKIVLAEGLDLEAFRFYAADFNADGYDDLVAYDPLDKTLMVGLVDNGVIVSAARVAADAVIAGQTVPFEFMTLQCAADFNGDGNAELLLTGPKGTGVIFEMEGLAVKQTCVPLGASLLKETTAIVQYGDYNGDRVTDLLTMNTPAATGAVDSVYQVYNFSPIPSEWHQCIATVSRGNTPQVLQNMPSGWQLQTGN